MCWCTVYLSRGMRGHLDWQVLRAPQYVNPALGKRLVLVKLMALTIYAKPGLLRPRTNINSSYLIEA